MAKKPTAGRKSARRNRSRKASTVSLNQPNSEEVFKAAEKMVMNAFSSGLKIVAAIGAAAAKSASVALESLALGADKFSDLVKKETLSLPDKSRSALEQTGIKSLRKTARKKTRASR